ncbi:O-antigen ligase family protein [Ancylobacter sp. FA202]|uniref:O-antigen ligase family protein n=1 Tax=Ancylobacter sp. FA202 TaxID=1111106 RepID=UPI00036E7D91|nr:O-antigen ligase family protein [Ancylobacter sp. FA202]
MNALAIACFWSLALWGLFSRRQVLLWLFFAMLPFGAFAVVPVEVTGGLSILAVHVTAAFFLLRRFLLRRHGITDLLTTALRWPGVILTVFWAVALLVTLFAPRLLAGQVAIVPMATAYQEVALLRPTLQNVSQLGYLTVSTLLVFAFANFFRSPQHQPLILRGLMFSGIVTIITGVLSYLNALLPLDPFLDAFKNASYALLDAAAISDGSRRITGLMPEASAYGALTLSLLSCLYFLRGIVENRAQAIRLNSIIIALAILLVMSTSSAGYVGLGVLGLLIGLDWFTRAFRINRPRFSYSGVRQDFFLALAIIGFAAAAVMVTPGVFEPVMERLDEMVFNKTETSSYVERSAWSARSLQAGLDSYLLGVGLGSTRASNFAVVLFASTGLLGFTLYFAFVAWLLLTSAATGDPRLQGLASGLKWSFFPAFVVSLLIGTTPDFGVFEALRFGALMALLRAGGAAMPAARAGPVRAGSPDRL